MERRLFCHLLLGAVAGTAPLARGARAQEGAAVQESVPLAAFLGEALNKYRVPALFGAVVLDGTLHVAAVGNRIAGAALPVTLRDRMRIGSISKPITATLLARLIDRGLIQWETRLLDVFPQWQGVIQPKYESVTLSDLLAHRSGMDDPPAEIFSHFYRTDSRLPIIQRRREWSLIALRHPPRWEYGSYHYSNGGYQVVASLAEAVTRRPLELLYREHLYSPLGMMDSATGMPGTASGLDQPWYHPVKDSKPGEPFAGIPQNDQSPIAIPQGGVVVTITDLARLAKAHLDGARGAGTLLQPATFTKMHADPRGDECGRGWRRIRIPELGGLCLEHGGMNGDGRGHWQTGFVRIAPTANLAVIVNTNAGGQNALDAVHQLRDRLQAECRSLLRKG